MLDKVEHSTVAGMTAVVAGGVWLAFCIHRNPSQHSSNPTAERPTLSAKRRPAAVEHYQPVLRLCVTVPDEAVPGHVLRISLPENPKRLVGEVVIPSSSEPGDKLQVHFARSRRPFLAAEPPAPEPQCEADAADARGCVPLVVGSCYVASRGGVFSSCRHGRVDTVRCVCCRSLVRRSQLRRTWPLMLSS